MLRHSMPDVVFLNFCNYCNRKQLGDITGQMKHIEKRLNLSVLHYYGYGPAAADISEYVK